MRERLSAWRAKADGLTARQKRRDGQADLIDDIGLDELVENGGTALAQNPPQTLGLQKTDGAGQIDVVVTGKQQIAAGVLRHPVRVCRTVTGHENRPLRTAEQAGRQPPRLGDHGNRWRRQPAPLASQLLLDGTESGRPVVLGPCRAGSHQYDIGEGPQVT